MGERYIDLEEGKLMDTAILINTDTVFRYSMSISYSTRMIKDSLITNTIYSFINFPFFYNSRARLVDISSKTVTLVPFKSIMYFKNLVYKHFFTMKICIKHNL